MELTEFISARLDEDEAVARAALTDETWWVDGPAAASGHWWIYPLGVKFVSRPAAEHIARHDPARVLAQVKAYRKIVEVESAFYFRQPQPYSHTRRAVLYALASIWRNHEQYDPAWEA